MTASPLFDKGLQPERTLLAWCRTCLAFATANLIALRFTVELAGVVAVVVAIVGAGLAIAAYVLAAVGYRRVNVGLLRDGVLTRGGMPMLFATGSTLLLGAAAVIFVAIG